MHDCEPVCLVVQPNQQNTSSNVYRKVRCTTSVSQLLLDCVASDAILQPISKMLMHVA